MHKNTSLIGRCRREVDASYSEQRVVSCTMLLDEAHDALVEMDILLLSATDEIERLYKRINTSCGIDVEISKKPRIVR